MRQRCRFDNVPIVFPETPAGIGSSIPFGVYLSLQVYFGSFSVSSSLQVFLSRLFRCSPEPAIPRPSLQGTTSEYKSLLAQKLAQAVLIGGALSDIYGKVLAPLLVHAPLKADQPLDSCSRRAHENSSVNGHIPRSA